MLCDNHLRLLSLGVYVMAGITIVNPFGFTFAVNMVWIPLDTHFPPQNLSQCAKLANVSYTTGIFVAHALRELLFNCQIDYQQNTFAYVFYSILIISLYMQPIACLSVNMYFHCAQDHWFKTVYALQRESDTRTTTATRPSAIAPMDSTTPTPPIAEGRPVIDVAYEDENLRVFEDIVARLIELETVMNQTGRHYLDANRPADMPDNTQPSTQSSPQPTTTSAADASRRMLQMAVSNAQTPLSEAESRVLRTVQDV